MARVEKLSIALTPEMASVVRQCVENGEYASSSEIIREALRDWQHKRDLQQAEIEELRRLWKDGIESGTGRFSSMEEIKAEAQRRFSSRNQAQ